MITVSFNITVYLGTDTVTTLIVSLGLHLCVSYLYKSVLGADRKPKHWGVKTEGTVRGAGEASCSSENEPEIQCIKILIIILTFSTEKKKKVLIKWVLH